MKVYYKFFTIFLFVSVAYAQMAMDCKVISDHVVTECNQYSSKLIRAKSIRYDKDRHRLIQSKILPLPDKKKIKVISVEDIIEKYLEVEDSLRYKVSPLNNSLKRIKSKKVKSNPSPKKTKSTIIVHASKKQDTLNNMKHIKTHVLIRNIGIYKVLAGDTLTHVAKKFGLTKEKLISLNHINLDAKLKIGQEFKIPLPQIMINAIASGEYTIEDSDTLNTISHKFKIDVKKLADFNHIKLHTLIRKGKKLQLPLPHIVKELEQKKKTLLTKKEAKKTKHVKIYSGNGKRKLRVTATAYTSHSNQTDSTPFLAAWNNHIRPGMKILAVSRDLLYRYGIRNGTKVRIGGLPGYYIVRDKMNKRYKRRIDIYMGMNKRRALRWGRRSVNIYY